MTLRDDKPVDLIHKEWGSFTPMASNFICIFSDIHLDFRAYFFRDLAKKVSKVIYSRCSESLSFIAYHSNLLWLVSYYGISLFSLPLPIKIELEISKQR